MKKDIFRAKSTVMMQKKKYIFLIGLALVGIIAGILFIFILNKDDSGDIKRLITNFFDSIINKSNNKNELFFNALINNSVYIIFIWLLGLSIIGLPIIVLIYFFKSFILGFSMSSIIYTYGFKGIIKLIVNIFPHQIIFLLLLVLITFYAMSFSIKLLNYLFFKKVILFKNIVSKYLKILGIVLLINVVVCLYEAYISTYLISILNF